LNTTQRNLHRYYATTGGATNVFSTKVADYIASRPDYPAALFDELATRCDLNPQSHVADVGAGTGLLTRDLLARGYRVTAVEPNREMRAPAMHYSIATRTIAASMGPLNRCHLPTAQSI
jgi:2-polyprenyl-3-methyl-5-hydroxy-6-metoxy-1,4-benzoquinol methylase